ncbi:hypothetical protein GRAN_0670 [Granulicella sibirica]|uniref:Uncharacterized protein n=1 Tax=Granulicella sibirica TaxID=2479048 RepID=A0A4Q0T487_9BACT|nr:hypothetical protein GRAN_0670 [Granulicella sibirica]
MPTGDDNGRPLPDVSTLMHEVEAHQKAAEAIIKDYTYTSSVTQVELDGHGNLKKSESEEADVFYVDGIRVERTTKKNGQELTLDEQKKEKERVDKHIAKARERREKKEAGHEDDTVTFSRFLELGAFSNERRVMLRGRSTIALDYTGDPKAKTHNPLEGAIHELAGTVWVDEQDHALSRVEGHFANNFKIGGGLLVNVAKGTSFEADSNLVNGEVWLPSRFSGQGSARMLLLFNMNGRAFGSNSNYRKFKASSTILPGVQEVDSETPSPESAPTQQVTDHGTTAPTQPTQPK